MHKTTHKFLFAAFVFIFGCGAAFAQQTISPEKQALIKELLEVSGGQKGANDMVDTMITFQEREAPKMISSLIESDKNLAPAQKNELRRSIDDSAKRVTKRIREFLARMNFGQMIEDVSYPLYDANFTENELRDMIAFYRTSTGQKVITVAPKLAMEAMMAFAEKFAPKMEEFMKETTASELALLKEKLRKSPGKKPSGGKS